MESNLNKCIEIINEICILIKTQQEYLEKLKACLSIFSQGIEYILKVSADDKIPFEINERFVVQVLNDVLDGIEREDEVFLCDVLQFGLYPIYEYSITQLYGENVDEQIDL